MVKVDPFIIDDVQCRRFGTFFVPLASARRGLDFRPYIDTDTESILGFKPSCTVGEAVASV